MGRGRIRGAAASLAVTVGLSTAVGHSQVTNATPPQAPPRLTLDFSSSLTHDSNPSLALSGARPSTTFDNAFALNFNTATPQQTFAFSADGVLRASEGAGDNGLHFRDPGVKLSYQITNGNTLFSVNGAYKQTLANLFEPVGGFSTDVIATTGTITTQTAGFNFQTGLNNPLGFDLSGTYSDRSYSQTTDPNVFDSHTQSLNAGVHLRMASGDTVGLTLGTNDQFYENTLGTTRKGQTARLQYSRNLRPDLKLNASVGTSKNTTRITGGTIQNQSSGAVGSIGLVRTFATGNTASATLQADRDALGARNTLTFGADMALPNGKLAATLGMSERAGAGGQVIGTLSYTHTLPVDVIGVQISRQVALNADDIDIANTNIDLTYTHKLSVVANFGLSLSMAATGSAGGGAVASASRQTLRATYSHDLPAGWQVSGGYQYRALNKSASGNADSSSVFLTLNRKFTLLP